MKTEAVLLAVILGVWGLSISAQADPWRGILGESGEAVYVPVPALCAKQPQKWVITSKFLLDGT